MPYCLYRYTYILNTITTTLRHFSVVATLFIKQDVVQERALLVLPAAAAAVVAILRRSHSNVAAAVLWL